MKRFICLLILVLTAFASKSQSVCRVAVDSLMFRIDTTDYWLKTYTPDKDSWFSFVRTKPATTDSKIGLCTAVKTLDFSKWVSFEDEEEEMELTHFETCMGPVEKAYAFVIEW